MYVPSEIVALVVVLMFWPRGIYGRMLVIDRLLVDLLTYQTANDSPQIEDHPEPADITTF